jgi:hypothetical protein
VQNAQTNDSITTTTAIAAMVTTIQIDPIFIRFSAGQRTIFGQRITTFNGFGRLGYECTDQEVLVA